jgi:hypothetical protein
MKRQLFMLAIMMLSFIAVAQTPDRKGYVALSIGPSFPVGDFAGKSAGNISAGLAENGYISNILNVGYRIGDHLGACFAFFYGEYKIGEENSNDWWQVTGLSAGPQYTFLPGGKFEVDLKARIDFLMTQKVIDFYGTEEDDGRGLGIDLRATLRYNLFKRWCLLAEVGYFDANQKFGDGHKGKIQAVLTGFGVGFRFY